MISKKHAFTLIELLVVILIISLLISILLPALKQAIASARQIKCTIQIRSVGQALFMYQTSNKMYYPYGLDTRTSQKYISNALNTYLSLATDRATTLASPQWHCTEVWSEAQDIGTPKGMYGIYACNTSIMGWVAASGYVATATPFSKPSSTPSDIGLTKEADLTVSPSSQILFTEGFRPMVWVPYAKCIMNYSSGANQWHLNNHFRTETVEYPQGYTGTNFAGVLATVKGRAATVFRDGHTQVVKPSAFLPFWKPSASTEITWKIDP